MVYQQTRNCIGKSISHFNDMIQFQTNSMPNNLLFLLIIKAMSYRKILPRILQVKKAEEDKVGVFAESEMQKGTSQKAYICCNKKIGTECKPFPKCCDCNRLSKEEEPYLSNKAESKSDGIWGSHKNKLDNHIEEVPQVEIVIN